MKNKNKFEVHEDIVDISCAKWDMIATTSYREDYYEELTGSTWGISGKYLRNKKLGYLHRYIMSKWYGKEVLDKMTEEGFVVDHMNNESFDCRISNLCFLSSDENTAKGFTVDKQCRDMLQEIALSLFKDFETGYIQMTIFFNKVMYFCNPDKNEYYPVSILKLLYDDEYEIVINDARYILLRCKKDSKFQIDKLNFLEYKIDKANLITLNPNDRNRSLIEIDGQQLLVINEKTRVISVNYEKGWKPKNNKKKVL